VPVDWVELAAGFDVALVADELVAEDPVDGALAGGGVAPPPRNENT
jgi:hypothetical protein